MDFAESVQPIFTGLPQQRPELLIAQRPKDQQDGVRTVGPRLQNLKLVDNKIFAQSRNVRCRRCLLQIPK